MLRIGLNKESRLLSTTEEEGGFVVVVVVEARTEPYTLEAGIALPMVPVLIK